MSAQVPWGRLEISGPRHAHRERLVLEALLPRLRPDARVLDAGCGSGSLVLALAERGYRVEGVEDSPGYVDRLAQKISARGLARLASVHQGTITKLPFDRDTFDVAIATEVLEHLPDDRAGAAELARVLRPGGACVVSVPAHPLLWDVTDEWAGHFRRYTRRGLIRLFADAGMSVEAVRFWGFPSVLIYHKLVFVPWVHLQRRRSSEKKAEIPPVSRPPGNFRRVAGALLEPLFRIDAAFSRLPLGIGLILVARKGRPWYNPTL